MSTGEQRRCLLGRALVHDPIALVLDEPTSGLDLTATFHYLDLVRAHMRKGKTLLLVTHHIHEIPPEVERVVLLKQGKILQDGEKRAVLTEANLSVLFDCPVSLAQANGWYQALPGQSIPQSGTSGRYRDGKVWPCRLTAHMVTFSEIRRTCRLPMPPLMGDIRRGGV